MLTEVYVVIKFNTGEQIMSIMDSEDDTYIQLSHPMTIKTIPVVSEGREHLTAVPFCQFTRDTTFVIDKKNVMFIKTLDPTMIPHYRNIVEQHKNTPSVQQRYSEEKFIDNEMTVEEARKRIAMLAAIAGLETEEEETVEETLVEYRHYIEGNDTKH
jgi:hypothetical protein